MSNLVFYLPEESVIDVFANGFSFILSRLTMDQTYLQNLTKNFKVPQQHPKELGVRIMLLMYKNM